MRYDVVVGIGRDVEDAASALRREVDNAIDGGWRPIGGVAIHECEPSPDSGQTFFEWVFAQAMVSDRD